MISDQVLAQKIAILDARDKRIREQATKQNELSKARSYIGSCQDMCPERERYLRQGFQMSIFERDQNNQPDEYAMVKEYRRAGADQEEPLPHELRTLQALEMTMDYLVCNLLDDPRSLSTEHALDWYDFLWDRLRAIRKDITQQSICDQTAATLVERCTRFHVHACYSMSRVNNFDVAMNKRSLNDCLQMLRQMYDDLRNVGVTCDGELEFQKYDILLHLDEDPSQINVLMKTSDFRTQTSMRFIIQIFVAYTTNDFVTFFKLMRKADYMTSCILSLYVNKVRLSGMKVITAACSTRQTASYPCDFAIELFGFDGIDDLSYFAATFGIEIQDKNSKKYLLLNKDLLNTFRQGEAIPLPSRFHRLIESKMEGRSVGLLVYGQPNLPENPYKQHPLEVTAQEEESLGYTQETQDTESLEYGQNLGSLGYSKDMQSIEAIESVVDADMEVDENVASLSAPVTVLQDDGHQNSYPTTQLVVSPGVRPVLASRLEDVTLYVDQTIEFSIRSIDLAPIDTCQWFRNDELIIKMANSSIFDSQSTRSSTDPRVSLVREEVTSEGQKLIIFRLTVEDMKLSDSARYKCRLSNEYGYDETECKVTVLQEVVEKHEVIEDTINQRTSETINATTQVGWIGESRRQEEEEEERRLRQEEERRRRLEEERQRRLEEERRRCQEDERRRRQEEERRRRQEEERRRRQEEERQRRQELERLDRERREEAILREETERRQSTKRIREEGKAPQFGRRLSDRTVVIESDSRSSASSDEHEELVVTTKRDEWSNSKDSFRIRWYVNELEIIRETSRESQDFSIDNFCRETDDEWTHRLVVKRSALDTSSGHSTFTCRASNDFGESETSCTVTGSKRQEFFTSFVKSSEYKETYISEPDRAVVAVSVHENQDEADADSYVVERPRKKPALNARELADIMPVGRFKKYSLSSKVPTLKAPPEESIPEEKKPKKTENVGSIKDSSIGLTIEDEAKFSESLWKAIRMLCD